jgi:hypothetical protein
MASDKQRTDWTPGFVLTRAAAGTAGVLIVLLAACGLLLFVLAALAEIGGARLIWQGWREDYELWWIAAGVITLGAYGFVATLQPDENFGRSWPPTAASSGPARLSGAWWSTSSDPTGGTLSAPRSASSASP